MITREQLLDFLKCYQSVALVQIDKVQGSSPREPGAQIFVSPAETLGTIGGGQLEYMMIDEARALLVRGQDQAMREVPLGPEIGQCCGGHVTVSLRRMTPDDREAVLAAAEKSDAARPHLYILGAGHVGRALAQLAAHLHLRTILIDSREAELARAGAFVEHRLTALPEAEIAAAPPGSAFVVLTHDHALDFLLAQQALARGDAAYVGMIGSATKRARFLRWCAEHGDGVDGRALICPIGAAAPADKRPEVIAAFALTEILTRLGARQAQEVDASTR